MLVRLQSGRVQSLQASSPGVGRAKAAAVPPTIGPLRASYRRSGPDTTGVRRPTAPVESQPSVPKIADFGLAKCKVDMGGSLTASRETLGTPCYMAPELATGARDADARTDVYGLGAILYELLTGRPPFVANSPMEVVRMVREEPPVPPKELNPDVPDQLEAVCLKCLEKDPDWRYQSAADVGEAVRA